MRSLTDSQVLAALPVGQSNARSLHLIQLRLFRAHSLDWIEERLRKLTRMGRVGVVIGPRLTRYYRKEQ